MLWESLPSGTNGQEFSGHPCTPCPAPHPGVTILTQGTCVGESNLLRTFLVSGGMESLFFEGSLDWLGFWACLLQARGFVGSPNDLQNSTYVGEKG